MQSRRVTQSNTDESNSLTDNYLIRIIEYYCEAMYCDNFTVTLPFIIYPIPTVS